MQKCKYIDKQTYITYAHRHTHTHVHDNTSIYYTYTDNHTQMLSYLITYVHKTLKKQFQQEQNEKQKNIM